MKLFHRLALFFQRLDEQRIFEDEGLRFQLPKGLDCRDLRGEFEGELLMAEMEKQREAALQAYNESHTEIRFNYEVPNWLPLFDETLLS